jgi:hypothetical protein
MSQIDLTTLELVRAWVGPIQNTDSDDLLETLISAWSRAVYGYIQGPIVSRSVSERRDGPGGQRLMLRNMPVTSVSSLVINGVAVPAADMTQASPSGYYADAWDGQTIPARVSKLDVFGAYAFWKGRANVAITYQAGYLQANEAATVSTTDYTVTAQAPQGAWAGDGGVRYASSGATLVPVVSGPTAGQYTIDDGLYTFSAADSGAAVLLSYSFVPADIGRAVTAMVGEDFRYKDRIGMTSKSLGGQETMAYSSAAIPPRYKMVLDQYRNVVTV